MQIALDTLGKLATFVVASKISRLCSPHKGTSLRHMEGIYVSAECSRPSLVAARILWFGAL